MGNMKIDMGLACGLHLPNLDLKHFLDCMSVSFIAWKQVEPREWNPQASTVPLSRKSPTNPCTSMLAWESEAEILSVFDEHLL